MDVLLNAQFQRVETALNTLVESIASFNPSPQAALDLVAADDDLNRGLDQLAAHQANHARILALRAEEEALETRVKASVATLASLRRELQETPATAFPENSRPIPFDELLQFAKNISKHTVPPTYREPVPKDDAGQDKDGGDVGSGGVPSNGMNTPAISGAGAGAGPGASVPADQPGGNEQHNSEPEVPKEVTPEQAEWLRKLYESGRQWTPWPQNEKIWQGNLMWIQGYLDRNIDPASIDIPAEIRTQERLMMGERSGETEVTAEEKPGAKEEPQPAELERTEPEAPVRRPSAPQQPQQQFTGFLYDDDDD
ncbi:hypothetical protein CC78DRAFT_540137 [Lojkania enalia]|uniref:Mediator of RNA polymerase II transcription subunit 4 n=1 Tax=Lojkania enalia TaxID=147567 RepID=A0A9P4TPV8_9PLEO|nr:hypothetical protein CC78DRAFT_540137 [Didymosphaeria enalia]